MDDLTTEDGLRSRLRVSLLPIDVPIEKTEPQSDQAPGEAKRQATPTPRASDSQPSPMIYGIIGGVFLLAIVGWLWRRRADA